MGKPNGGGEDNLAYERDTKLDGASSSPPKPETEPAGDDPRVIELFKYSDGIDKILLLVGTIFSFLAAGVYPLMFFMFGRVASSLVAFQQLQLAAQNYTFPNNSCFDLDVAAEVDIQGSIDENLIFYILFGSVSILCNYIGYACFETSAERQIRRIRNMLFKSMISQEMAFFDKSSPGELNSKITSNVQTLRLGMGFKISDFVSLCGRGLGCFIYAMIAAWKFSIVFLAIMPFMSGSVVILINLIKKYTIIELKAYGYAGKIAQEVLSSIRTILAFGSMRHEVKKYGDNLHEAQQMATKKGLITGFFTGLALFLFNCCFAIGIYYGVYLVRTDCETYEPGDIVRSLFLMITATFSIGQGLPFLKDLAEARGSARAIFDIIDRKSEIDVYEKAGKIRPKEMLGEITFEDVHFAYPQRLEAKILRGLYLRIPAGKTVALCGSSGCGKSTTIQLLQRFYSPTSGKIKIDGVEIEKLDLEWMRSQMALVSQEPILFSATIRENIRLGRMDATDEEIEEAARCANAHNFIMSYPNNYDTQVGERGGQLSGGQKQRIAIARAILRNPKILLLDEATSALDYESERIVQDALDKAKVGRTTIIIAHRLSTIRNADIIVGIGNGRLREIGTHDQLMNYHGIYHELVMSQTKGSEEEKKQQAAAVGEQSMLNIDRFRLEVDNKASKKPEDEEDDGEDVIVEGESLKKMPMYKVSMKMWRYHAPELIYLIVGSITQAMSSLVNPIVSLIFTEIYEIFALPSAQEQEEKSLKLMSIIFGISVANFLSTLSFNYCFSLIGSRLTKRLRVDMFEALLRQEVAYHDMDENKSSVLATKLAASIPFCKGLTSDLLSLTCQALAGVGFSVIVGLIINWKLCLVIMAFIPINFIAGFINIQARTNKSGGKNTEEEGGRIAVETIESIKTVVSLGRENYFYGQFTQAYDRNFRRTLCMVHVRGIFYAISTSVLFFIQAAAFSYGFNLVVNENLRVPNLYKVYGTITFSSMTLGRLFAEMPDSKKARSACEMFLKTVNRQSKIDSMSEEGLRPQQVVGDIRFRDVFFKYPNRPNLKILNGLNLHIRPGESNALVGQSGCGKSTTIALLMRFYDIDSGSVELDGVDVRQLNIQWLRSKIGIVSQEPVLFNMSILENIKYGRIDEKNIPMTDIIEVSQAANINDRIQSLPQKYETKVGTKGGQLSGGEKQRIAIARALLRRPQILLLDEATSALDNESEKVVQDALDRAQQGRSCIVIAHRLSTIRGAHKISVVKAGVVVEEGAHDDLIAKQGFYYRLSLQNSQNAAKDH